MNNKFLDFIAKYKTETVALAVSGGADSMALMHWYAYLARRVFSPSLAEGVKLPVILHVNHHLRKESDIEAEYVAEIAAQLGLRYEILHWTGDKPAAGIEAAARKARYDLMLDFCRKNNIGVLMTAHQADDQIETFLMNLGRGSGVYGLGGIRAEQFWGFPFSEGEDFVSERALSPGRELKKSGVVIARPLLHVFRKELQDWCDANGVKYFSDTMNEDENFTRVKIRKNRHLLRDRLGIDDDRILLAIENLARAREALEQDIGRQLSIIDSDDGRIIFPAAQLFSLPEELQLKLLGELLRRTGGAEYAPRLKDIIRLLGRLSGDTISTLSNCAIRRFNDKILIAPKGASISFRRGAAPDKCVGAHDCAR